MPERTVSMSFLVRSPVSSRKLRSPFSISMKNLSENKLESKDNNIHSANKEQKQPEFLESNDTAHNLTIQPSITLAKEGKPDLQININIK